MTTNSFFNPANPGNTKWWTWPCVFWLMLMTWIFGQLVLTMPFGEIANNVSPELGQTFQEAGMEMFADEVVMAKLAAYGLGFLITSIIGLVFFFISYHNNGSSQRVLAIISGIGMALSFMFLVLLFPMASGGEGATAAMNQVLGASPMAYMLMLLTFPAALVGLYLGYKFIHKRTITMLHTAYAKFRWKRAITAFFVMWGVIAAAHFMFHMLGVSPAKYVFDPSRFAVYALISLLLLPIQSATEEIVFRGYLNQWLMKFLKNKWVVFTITSALFMAMHLANPEALAGAEAGILPIVMSGYFIFGFAACLMVLMDDGLESAIGVHAGNNTFAAIFVNYENSVLPTPSVFEIKAEPVYDSISTIILMAVVLGILYMLKKRDKAVIT